MDFDRFNKLRDEKIDSFVNDLHHFFEIANK